MRILLLVACSVSVFFCVIAKSRTLYCLADTPHGCYVYCVISTIKKMETAAYRSEGSVLLRQVSWVIRIYCKPDSNWELSAKLENLY